jgi:hypothetical protein
MSMRIATRASGSANVSNLQAGNLALAPQQRQIVRQNCSTTKLSAHAPLPLLGDVHV